MVVVLKQTNQRCHHEDGLLKKINKNFNYLGRSIWRLKYISKCTTVKIIKESYGINFFKKNSIITDKSSTIPKSLDKILFYIHKGNRYRELKVSKYHVGFKFGEFVLNRKPHVFKKKSKTKETRR